MLGPSNRGSFEILMLYPALIVAFGNLGIGNANLYFIAKKRYSVEKIVGNSLSLTFMLGGVLFAFTLALAYLTADFMFEEIPFYYCLLAFAAIPMLLFQRLTGYIFLGKEMIHLRNRLSIFPAIAIFFLNILLVVILKMSVLGAVISQLLSGILTFILGFYLLQKISRPRLTFDYNLLIESVKYGIVPFLALVIINLNFKMDIFLIKYFLDNTQVGYYSLGVSLAEKIWLVPEAFSLVLFSRVSNIEEREADILTPKVCRITLLFSIAVSLFLLATGNFIIPFIYGKEFKPSVVPLFLLLPGVVAMTLYLLIHSDLTGRGKAAITLKIFSAALFLNLVLNIILIPRAGINGAALASTISYTLGALSLSYIFSKEIHVSLKDIFIPRRSDYRDYLFPLFAKSKSFCLALISRK